MNEQAELLRQCRDSGQMSAAQVYEHEQAGDFDTEKDDRGEPAAQDSPTTTP